MFWRGREIKSFSLVLILSASLLTQVSVAAEKSGSGFGNPVLAIAGGRFTPLYGLPKKMNSVLVKPFRIDRYPVTNADYLAFVQTHDQWQRAKVPEILSDKNYLKHWTLGKNGKRDQFRPEQARKPVVNVPWFAANDYCVAKAGRLPKVNEWEFVAAADETKPNALRDPQFVERLLAWYSRPSELDQMRDIGQERPNFWGLNDLHGLVWEWTQDFNSVFVTGDNRQDGDDLKNLFCGASATNAADKSDYAAFMRYALRNSVKASYTLENLGFRCAYDF